MHDYTNPRANDPVSDRIGLTLFVWFLLLVYMGVVLVCMGNPSDLEISAERYKRIDTLDLALNHRGPTHDLIVECMRDGKIDLTEEKAIHDRYAQQRLDEMKWRRAN